MYYDDNQVPFSPTHRHFADPARVKHVEKGRKRNWTENTVDFSL